MKTITATSKGIAINYEKNHKSSFIPYDKMPETKQYPSNNDLVMNPIQLRMYRRLMYGMQSFTEKEIETMNPRLIFTITNEHKRAIAVVEEIKYEKHYGPYNKLLSKIFTHIEFDYYKDGKFYPLPSLNELRITKFEIVDAWINHKLLPLNFYEIKAETLNL